MIPRSKYYFAQQCDGRTLSVSLSVRQQPGGKPLSVSHPVTEQPVYARQSVVVVRSGNKTLPVRQRAACVYMSVCCCGSVWKQATASQSVRKQPVYACQPVVIVQSGNEPLSVKYQKIQSVVSQSVSQSPACVYISVSCHGAILR